MGLKNMDIFAALLLNLIQYVCSEHFLPCNDTLLKTGCLDNQICNSTTLRCDCLRGFIRIGDECEEPTEGHDGTTIIIVTLFTIALIIGAAVLVIRKYNLIAYLQQKIQSRRNNDVMYEDVMIGNDDPPLSP